MRGELRLPSFFFVLSPATRFIHPVLVFPECDTLHLPASHLDKSVFTLLNEEVILNRRCFTVLAAIVTAATAMPFASAQTPANIAVVMGNGQLVCSAGCTAAPPPTFPGALYAIVTDANNNPIPSYPT